MIQIDDSEIKALKDIIKVDENKSREEVVDELFKQILSRLDEEGRLNVLYYCLINNSFNRLKKRRHYTTEPHNSSKS